MINAPAVIYVLTWLEFNFVRTIVAADITVEGFRESQGNGKQVGAQLYI